MSRRAVIHAGSHKTGTTSIQAALYAGREALARHGYAYPDTPEQQQHTTSHFAAINGLFFRRGRAVTADFLAGIRSSRTSTVLSAENLFGLPRRALGEPLADYWSRKAGILGDFRDGLGMQEMLVVVFLRDPADYLVSLFRQYLKSPVPKAATLDGCFAEFATAFGHLADYGPQIAAWRAEFGAVATVDYDELVRLGESSVAAFTRVAALPDLPEPEQRRNISLDWSRLEAKRLRAQSPQPPPVVAVSGKARAALNAEIERAVRRRVADYLDESDYAPFRHGA